MKKNIYVGLLLISLCLLPNFSVAAPSMSVSFEAGSGTYDANTTVDGFTSQSNDPIAPFSGQSVMFKGTEEASGQYLTFRYKIDFSETVTLKEIILQGVAFCGDTNLRIFDVNMNEISSISMWGGNSFQTFLLLLPSGINGTTFYLQEEDGCPGWRYRSKIQVIINDEPLILKKVNWWNGYIVHAEYADGSLRRWTGFEMQDENGDRISNNVISSVRLYDPDGIEVSPIEVKSEPYRELMGRYMADTGKWDYDDQFNTYSGEYYVYFHDTPLKTGLYHLQLTDIDGNTHDAYNYCNGPVDLPVIPSSTFRGYEDDSGNFIWTWSVPYNIDPEIDTQVRAWIKIYNEDVFISDVYITLPTHFGRVFIPNSVFQKIKSEGNVYKAGLHLRERRNRSRTYSNDVNIDNLPPIGYSDINGDGKTGLIEAIHCLRIVSGIE